MKVVLFCGGYGTRIREYSDTIPKPMVPIGERPVLWHIMKYYAHFGHTEFILCLGYQGTAIKRYFLEYDETVSNDFVMRNGQTELLNCDIKDWRITFVDTGLETNIAGRLRKVREYVENEELFIANYSDGLTDHHLPDMIDHVRNTGAVGGFLAVRPPYSFHVATAEPDGTVTSVHDLKSSGLRINGGYFVLRPEIFDYMLPGEEMTAEPFQRMVADRALTSIPYDGFWMSMDTFKEKQQLDQMYSRGERPWQLWRPQAPAFEGALPSSR